MPGRGTDGPEITRFRGDDRMASAIECYLYGSRGTHAVVWFALGPSRVVVAVAPWN
jgi:hypothetical protein